MKLCNRAKAGRLASYKTAASDVIDGSDPAAVVAHGGESRIQKQKQKQDEVREAGRWTGQ